MSGRTTAIDPPPSTFPRLADGTAITREAALERFRALPGMALLDPDQLPRLRRLDLGPDTDRGIGRLPAETGEAYPSYVSALDATGNEIAGIRLPDLSVPVATHTGWVPRHPETGGNGELLDMMGTSLPLARTSAERQERADPRASIAELYRDRNDYLARARAAADDLVATRYILAEDVDLAVDLAVQRYDVLAREAVGV